MKIRLASDIHTEFMKGFTYEAGELESHILTEVLPPLEGDKDTVLVLAGDIGSQHHPECLELFIDHVAPRFELVLGIPGNHDGYGGTLGGIHTVMQPIWHRHANVEYNDMLVKVHKGVTFVGATLWTDMNGGCRYTEHFLRSHMNDYRLIGNGLPYPKDFPISSQDTLDLHFKHKAFIEANAEEGCVVFTHHAPSFKSVREKYKNDPLMNGGYATDLEELILRKKPKFWLHGHMHDGAEYKVGETTVVINPKGYVGERGNSGYRKDLILEV